MTMTIEEQFAQVAKDQEENLEREVVAGATYLKLINENFGSGSDIYYTKEYQDEAWSPAQSRVWRYLLTNDHLSYIHLTELLREVGTSGAVWSVVRHALWMSYFCMCETEEEADETIEQAKQCEDCQDTAIVFTMQHLLFAQPMSAQIVASIVHSGGMYEFAQMMWEVVEATGQGFYHSELRQNSLQVA
jgi:hypothetical protein